MSTALTNIKEKIKQELATQSRTFEQPGAAKISTAGKKFTLPNGQTSQGPLRVIILDHRHMHTYYTGVYNPNSPETPKCFAIGKLVDELAPSEAAEKPQSEGCKECEHNQWGSDPQGGKGKACKNSVRMLVAPADLGDKAEAMALDASPTSMKSFNSLLSRLDSNGLLPIQTVVEITFNDEVAYPQLIFKEVGANDKLEEAWALREASQPLLERHPAQR